MLLSRLAWKIQQSLQYTHWLNSAELDKTKRAQVSESVNRTVREDQNITIQDKKATHQNWDKSVSSTDLLPKVQDSYTTDRIVISESESESDSVLPILTPQCHSKVASRGIRCQPSREINKGINHKGMFVLCGKQDIISEEIISAIFESDCVYLSSLNFNVKDFTSTSETRSFKIQCYLSADNTYEMRTP